MTDAMRDDQLAQLQTLLTEHAAEFGIDAESVWRPSSHALAAWRCGGGLLRIDVDSWSAAELIR